MRTQLQAKWTDVELCRPEHLMRFTVKQLREVAAKHGIKKSGPKAELVERICRRSPGLVMFEITMTVGLHGGGS